jgi:hypothetical protein
MDEELVGGRLVAWTFEVEDDVLADAMDAGDAKSSEDGGKDFWIGLEGLAGTAEDSGEDALAVGAVMDALGDGFDFGEFGHGVGLVSHCGGAYHRTELFLKSSRFGKPYPRSKIGKNPVGMTIDKFDPAGG